MANGLRAVSDIVFRFYDNNADCGSILTVASSRPADMQAADIMADALRGYLKPGVKLTIDVVERFRLAQQPDANVLSSEHQEEKCCG